MKKRINICLMVISGLLFLNACSSRETVSDMDGNLYEIIKIGDQDWLSVNLNVSRFLNGDPIPEARTAEEWKSASENKQPAWCYYDNDPSNGHVYGKLYNWYAVNDPRGLAPEGWRIPVADDWNQLITFLGGDNVAGLVLKSTDLWADYEGQNGNGNNASGFAGLPGGGRYDHGGFNFLGNYSGWWTTTQGTSGGVSIWRLTHGIDNVYSYNLPTGFGLSVRCIRE